MSIGGPPRRVSIDGRSFSCTGDSNADRTPGGTTVTDVEPNTDLTARIITQVFPWMYEGIKVSIDDKRKDLEFLKDVQKRGLDGVYVVISVTEASGLIYRGKGQVVGELKREGEKGVCPLTLKGPGELTS